MLIWIGVIAASAMDLYISGERLFVVVLHAFFSSICSGVTLCLSYAMVFVARSLTTMIDAFCCDVVGQTDLQEVASGGGLGLPRGHSMRGSPSTGPSCRRGDPENEPEALVVPAKNRRHPIQAGQRSPSRARQRPSGAYSISLEHELRVHT